MGAGKRTILVAEDDLAIRQTLVEVLRHEGYVVAEAASGNAALCILKSLTVDLVISDIQMENGDGFFLLQEINKIGTEAPPLLFISAHTEISVKDVQSRGARALVRKPIDIKELLDQILSLIGRVAQSP